MSRFTGTFYPTSMQDLLQTCKSIPHAPLCAGNTCLLNPASTINLLEQKSLITLDRVEELRRSTSTERYIGYGAMMPLEKIMYAKLPVMPRSIIDCIVQSIPFPIRNLATIGGNIMNPDNHLGLIPLLDAWESHFEIRRLGNSRQIKPKGLNGKIREQLEPGEVLTRIYLPLRRWNYSHFLRMEGSRDSGLPPLGVGIHSNIGKDNIEEINITWALSNRQYYHFSALDTVLIGQKLPLTQKEINNYLEQARENFLQHPSQLSPLIIHRLCGLAWQMLIKINHKTFTSPLYNKAEDF